jgi:hypothetical protein
VPPTISFRWSFDHRRIPGPPLPVWSGSVGATARNCRAARLVMTARMYHENSKPQALPSKRNGLPRGQVSFPGVRGKQRWVAAVPLINEMVVEVRKRIPADAILLRASTGCLESDSSRARARFAALPHDVAMRPLHWRPRSVRRHWQCAACFRLGSPRSLKRPRWTFCAPPLLWRTARRRPRGATILRRTAGRLNWVVAPASQCH